MFNLVRDRGHARGVEEGAYPLEALQRGTAYAPTQRVQTAPRPRPPASKPLAGVARAYERLYTASASTTPLPRAPVPDDLTRRAREIKGAAYYLDAAHVGICELPDCAWFAPQDTAHRHAIVLLAGYGRRVEAGNPAADWLEGAEHDIAHLRATEIGVCLAGHLHALGFNATLHDEYSEALCVDTLALAAGVAQPSDAGIASPFIGRQFAAVAITTDYALAADLPLAPDARLPRWRQWLGVNGATSGREHRRRAKRASHLSRYPMEHVRRVERPTTVILDDEIPRVPQRANFFTRARMGDLGAKAQQEVKRFALKHPLTHGMTYPLRALVPHQDGVTAARTEPGFTDAAANSRAVKSLGYHLGADLIGICEVPRYAWYSHDVSGNEIPEAHRYAVVLLIDQGYDTMEGASGDDWISGCQSMRGYLRGAEITGVMAEFLRGQGQDARPQTNADSQVLQIPLVLLAGLGELSRIGELVLNPFVGPRFKSAVLTTNLPLIPDDPIDFGLQKFCGNCLKCARECPVNAIPFGDKVMFNGYEIWKPDVERCTRYRVTNPKGSACGRCMKTCPLNKVVDADGALLHRIGTWLGIHTRWLKRALVPIAVYLDDKLGYGTRNPIKRWWLDLEIVDGQAQVPRGTNERDIDPNLSVNPDKSPVGYYHASDNPPPNAGAEAVPVNHKAAIRRAEQLETVPEAVARNGAGVEPPAHYIPVQPV